MPPLKLYERGQRNETLFTILDAASRTPDIVRADIGAYVGACIVGEARFRELATAYGRASLEHYLEELLNYTERLVRAEIANMPDGTYEFEDHLDDDGCPRIMRLQSAWQLRWTGTRSATISMVPISR